MTAPPLDDPHRTAARSADPWVFGTLTPLLRAWKLVVGLPVGATILHNERDQDPGCLLSRPRRNGQRPISGVSDALWSPGATDVSRWHVGCSRAMRHTSKAR